MHSALRERPVRLEDDVAAEPAGVVDLRPRLARVESAAARDSSRERRARRYARAAARRNRRPGRAGTKKGTKKITSKNPVLHIHVTYSTFLSSVTYKLKHRKKKNARRQ